MLDNNPFYRLRNCGQVLDGLAMRDCARVRNSGFGDIRRDCLSCGTHTRMGALPLNACVVDLSMWKTVTLQQALILHGTVHKHHCRTVTRHDSGLWRQKKKWGLLRCKVNGDLFAHRNCALRQIQTLSKALWCPMISLHASTCIYTHTNFVIESSPCFPQLPAPASVFV